MGGPRHQAVDLPFDQAIPYSRFLVVELLLLYQEISFPRHQ